MKIEKQTRFIDPQKINDVEVQETYQRISNLFKELLAREEQIYVERDEALRNTKGKGYIFYPECFKNLVETKAVKRMARIFQLGTNIFISPDINHTRLEHCKGTYYRTLEVFDNLFQDENMRSLIKNLNAEKYVLACLVRAILHDLGHGPFSHTMETICGVPKGFHEDVGLRLIRENKEIRDALNAIYPGMPEIYEEVINRNFLGLNRLFEGQIDVDRGDFSIRDCFFTNKKFDYVSHNIYELFDNITIDTVPDKYGKPQPTPVFEADQIENLNTFFRNRYKNYMKIYYNPNGRCQDNIYRAFAKVLINSDEDYRLKRFLMNNMGKSADEVDLDEYISFNDVEFMKGIIEVLDNTKDPILRRLALMSLPPKSQVPDVCQGLMVSVEQSDENGDRVNMTDSDDEFIRRLYEIEGVEEEFDRSFLAITSGKGKDVNAFLDKVKKELGLLDGTTEELEEMGIYSWNPSVVAYKNKPGEETYVRGRDGKIYEYSKHPEVDKEVLGMKGSVPGCSILLPMLEARGIEPEKINRIKEIYLEISQSIDERTHED